MRVTFWGTRGSIAKPGPTTVRYGGNTSCVEVETDGGTLLVIDCGTGAHDLGVDLVRRAEGAPIDGHLLVGHTHWDHIQGLPFFAPLFAPGSSWNIYGPRGLGGSILETLAGQMQYSYFPITLEQLAAQVEYHDLVDGVFEIDDITVVTEYLNHPALSLGYRVEADGATLVYASDHEPYEPALAHGGDIGTDESGARHLAFLRDADLLIHDAQYVSAEYAAKVGWGHSTMEYAVDAACQADVRRLALYHHDPLRTDDDLDVVVEQARARAADAYSDLDVFGAAEGSTIDLTGDPERPRRDTSTLGSAVRPAIDDSSRSILIAVRTPDIASTVRDAAAAEGLDIWETTKRSEIVPLASEHEPSIVVLESADDAAELAREIRALDSVYGADVNIVTVGGRTTEERPSPSLSDWLPWPFSAVYARTRMRASLLRRACRWERAEIPVDEPRRLESLRGLGVLDTPAEHRFDQLTREASERLGVPVALVSLVDEDRQWFKSAHGLDATETSRDASFCAHAILGDGVFQVPDALGDDRFADNPLVAGDPRVRFYAGVPLALADGSQVGTLCVIDYRPRLLGDDDLDVLRGIGAKVVEELES